MLGWEVTADLIYLDKLTPQFLTRADLVGLWPNSPDSACPPHGIELDEELWWTGGS
jgi:hypothetical protein